MIATNFSNVRNNFKEYAIVLSGILISQLSQKK